MNCHFQVNQHKTHAVQDFISDSTSSHGKLLGVMLAGFRSALTKEMVL